MQEQSSWSFGFAALGSLSTAIYAVFFVFEFFLNRKGKNKTNGVPSAENGPAKGAASSISKFLFKSLTALFAALGALVTALFAFLSLAALNPCHCTSLGSCREAPKKSCIKLYCGRRSEFRG